MATAQFAIIFGERFTRPWRPDVQSAAVALLPSSTAEAGSGSAPIVGIVRLDDIAERLDKLRLVTKLSLPRECLQEGVRSVLEVATDAVEAIGRLDVRWIDGNEVVDVADGLVVLGAETVANMDPSVGLAGAMLGVHPFNGKSAAARPLGIGQGLSHRRQCFCASTECQFDRGFR